MEKSYGSKIFDVCLYSIMIMLMLIMIYPIWNVFAVSISGVNEVMRNEVNIIPKNISFEIYKIILSLKEIQIGYINTILYSVCFMILTLVLTTFLAYPLANPNLPGRGGITLFLTITMFISGGLIPSYLLIRELGGIDSFWVMVVPGTVAVWNVIVMRTYFQTNIPISLIESALIDGATDIKILRSIVVPLSKPIYATIGLFALVGKWNSWFDALIYLNDSNRHPVQMILREIVMEGKILNKQQVMDALDTMAGGSGAVPINYQYTMLMVVMLPIIMVYPFLQKYFVKGVMVGSLKG